MTIPVEITITGVIPKTGKLVFASSTLVRDSLSNAVLPPYEIVVPVEADVEWTVDIPSTDDPEFSPTGWTWEVRPHFDGWREPFSVSIPYDSPDGAIWFSDLVEVPPDGDGDLYALANHTHAGGGEGGPIAISDVTGLTAALAAKAALASPTFTGTVAGITKSMVGLGSVDNTADTAKPISTATQTALDGKSSTSHDHSGTYQPLDSDLTTIAGLTPTTDNFMVAASSAWASRTPAQARTALLVAPLIVLGAADPVPGGTPTGTVIVRTA